MTLKKAYITPKTGGRQFIIGDIHGCSKTFRLLIRKLDLQKYDQLILLGDLVNKGPDAKGVIDYVLDMQEEGFEVYTLRGNNESMLLKILKKPQDRIEKLSVRFNVVNLFKKDRWEMKKRYKKFLKSTIYYIESEAFFAVHAGFDYSAVDPYNDTFQMMWMRNFKVDKEKQNHKQVVYGHRIYPFNRIKRAVKKEKWAIPIDNGCILGNDSKAYGRLVCYDVTNKQLITQQNADE